MEARYCDCIGDSRKAHYHLCFDIIIIIFLSLQVTEMFSNEHPTFAYHALIKVREGKTRICDYEIPLPDVNPRL